jgi:hypothetical protein
MRFFSNDARESTDEQAHDDRTPDERAQDEQGHDDRPDRVQSDPVVPSQRPPSPWSDTPSGNDDTAVVTDTDRRDGDADADRADTDPPPFHEPSPQPTAFGASTVGGAVASSAMANPLNDRWEATDRDSAADTGVGDDANVAPGDGVVTSSTDTYAGSTAGTNPATDHDPHNGHDHSDPDAVVDLPLDDRDSTATGTATVPAGAVSARSDEAAELQADREPVKEENQVLKDDGTFDDPKAVEPGTDTPVEATTVADERADETAGTTTDAGPLKDDGDFDDPKVVDPATDTPVEAADSTPTDNTPPEVVATPVAAAAAAPAAAGAGSLFAAADAQTFQDRWRDVQLRFVDSPKDAAGEAAKLVEEAVDKLTASLRSQRDGLHNDTDDTEQLRIQLRGYREMLNRILSL